MVTNYLSLKDVQLAQQRIVPSIRKTPLIYSPSLTEFVGSNVLLKLKNIQVTGAFKIWGAANKIISLSEEERERGVITVSSGNHGKAVSYMAKKAGGESHYLCIQGCASF
jgi:threonine dehydratase